MYYSTLFFFSFFPVQLFDAHAGFTYWLRFLPFGCYDLHPLSLRPFSFPFLSLPWLCEPFQPPTQ